MVIATAALIAPIANAQTTLGQTSSTAAEQQPCEFPAPYDEFALGSAPGVSYVAPAAGVITSWSTAAGPGAGQQLALKIYRLSPAGAPTSFTVVGVNSQALTPSTLNTFPVSIPVQAGDLVGLHVYSSELSESAPVLCFIPTADEADVLGFTKGDVPAGGSAPIESVSGGEVMSQPETKLRANVSATLLTAPTLSVVKAANGSVKGGSKVVLTGTEFAQVSGVAFGSTPAKSFTVDSETQITAVVPASKKLAKVPVAVTTIAGATTAAQKFSYQGCKVPGLSGKKLKAAEKTLKKAGCKTGKMTKKDGATPDSGKVLKQSPKPGKVLAPGSKVKVTLG